MTACMTFLIKSWNPHLLLASLCYSCRVTRYRTEAVVLAQGACSLKADLGEYEYQLECQSKELSALRLEHQTVKKELTAVNLQKEQLLDRWLEEKKEEAERINKHNATHERWTQTRHLMCIAINLLIIAVLSTRWQRLAGRLKKHYRARSRPPPCVANSTSEMKTTESQHQHLPSWTLQRIQGLFNTHRNCFIIII